MRCTAGSIGLRNGRGKTPMRMIPMTSGTKTQMLVSVEQMIEWTAEWIRAGGGRWDKPTHFEVRDGKF